MVGSGRRPRLPFLAGLRRGRPAFRTGAGAHDLAVANGYNDTVSVLLNQIAARADLNGSNRVDGLDVSSVRRLAGCPRGDPCYRHNIDSICPRGS